MKIDKKKAIATVTLLILLIVSSMAFLQNANAITEIPMYAFITVSPNPIGVSQTVNVNFWLTLVPPTASAQYGDRWQNMTIKVTKPDGTTETIGPFKSDATGGSHTTYTPTTNGNYTFQMFFGGQTLAGDNLASDDSPARHPEIGNYYKPAQSNVFTLTVQQEAITGQSGTPLPTEYWTRPIYAENNNWYVIASNWLGTGMSSFASTGSYDINGDYNPYTTAPNTAHIMWTKPVAFGGTIGGKYGGSETSNFYATAQYEPKFAPIILNGILYYTNFPGASTNPTGWTAVNLKTGETIWTKNTTEILRCGEILNYQSPNQYGGIAYLWSIPAIENWNGMASSLKLWDAMTGSYILTITNITASSLVLTTDASGGLVGYYVDSYANTLNLWNSTRCINLASEGATGSNTVANSWSWRPPQNAVIDFSLGIQWTKPLANDISGAPLMDFRNGLYGLALYGVWNNIALLYDYSPQMFQPGWHIEAAYSLIDGKQLWLENRTFAPYSMNYGDTAYSMGTSWMGDGAYVDYIASTQQLYCYSLTTGKALWGPITVPNASAFSTLGAHCQIANGTAYVWLYGGDVYAYDLDTGLLNWQYHTPSGGYESPYGRESIWTFSVGTIADGKLFLPEGHMYSPPLYHNAQQLALNITDGSVVWSIDAFDTTSAPAIVDGVMVTLNAYDNQLYAYGKGASAMTVTAPAVGVTTVTPITISGTILDTSAGTQQEAQKANYPYGVPCVSDKSMSSFMKTLYMQQPMSNNITGVPITLSVLDSNGNYRTIGTTTSDTLGTFAYNWTPDIAGVYAVYASFAGSESYYASNAVAHFYALEPTATPTPESTHPPSAADLYFVPGIIGVIIAILVVGAVMLLAIRKRP